MMIYHFGMFHLTPNEKKWLEQDVKDASKGKKNLEVFFSKTKPERFCVKFIDVDEKLKESEPSGGYGSS